MQFFFVRSFVLSFAFIYFDFFYQYRQFFSPLFQIVFFGIRFREWQLRWCRQRTNVWKNDGDDGKHCLFEVQPNSANVLTTWCCAQTIQCWNPAAPTLYPIGFENIVWAFSFRSPNIGMRILYLSLLCVCVRARQLFAQRAKHSSISTCNSRTHHHR